MRNFLTLFLVILVICLACQIPEEKPIAKVTVVPDTLSDFATGVLHLQDQAMHDLAYETWHASLDKLPADTSFYCDLQSNALCIGSKYSLSRHYRKINVPHDTSIRYLDLSYRNIYYIPNKVTKYPNLSFLSLRNNRIQAINPKLGQCRNLRKLDLSSNSMHRLPFGIIYLSQVKELILADNNLNSLPSYFFNLFNLKVLDISNLHTHSSVGYNSFETLPKVLLRMSHIEKLFLDKLPLRRLPNNMSSMKRLKVVSLNGNRRIDLDQAFEALSKLPNLIALDLSFLGRRTLPKSIAKLKNLKVLIWHEEGGRNKDFILQSLGNLLPNTKVYHSERKEGTPFLRGNSIKTIERAGY